MVGHPVDGQHLYSAFLDCDFIPARSGQADPAAGESRTTAWSWRPAPDFKLEGAREVRLAGQAFRAMSQRIQRQMVERTEMLAGVSHDLRTPLSRMKLQLEFLPDSPDRRDMEKDIDEMDRMITGYIDFASNAVVESVEKTSIPLIIEDCIRSLDHGGAKISVTTMKNLPEIPIRPRMIRRAIDNLIGNAIVMARPVRLLLNRPKMPSRSSLMMTVPAFPRKTGLMYCGRFSG